MTQRQHPAQRARGIALGASAAALAGITALLGFSAHTVSPAAATTATTVQADGDNAYLYGGAQPGAVSSAGNTTSRGS